MKKVSTKSSVTTPPRKQKPALDPDERENQMIAYAVNLAEQQLRDGTASSQVITHYLKMGSSKSRTEKEILELQKELIAAKTASLQSSAHIEEMYKEAMEAFKIYGGHGGAE